MKHSRLPIPRLTLAVFALLAAALLTHASAAHADLPTIEEELAIERSCEEWQKVRRCVHDDGEIGLECAFKSPFARFLSMFRSRAEDDEVVVVRKAPGETAEHRAESTESYDATEDDEVERQTSQQADTRVSERKRVVEGSDDRAHQRRRVVRTSSDLPRCGEDD